MPHMYSLFFYGTLMHQPILCRVIGSDGSHLTVVDAVLSGHTRHHVRGEGYPAVVPLAKGQQLLRRELGPDEGSVRGTLVTGLTDTDVDLLDEFEGSEYTRTAVSVLPVSSDIPQPAHVYLWTDPVARLLPALWTFEHFLRDEAHRWVGAAGDREYAAGEREYAEVDRRRGMKGDIVPSVPGAEEARQSGEGEGVGVGGAAKYEAFGRAFGKKWWTFEEGWTNLNHGSYGAAPKPVITALRDIQDRCAAAPDRFMRVEYMPQLAALRARLAAFIGADTDDVVMCTNASTAINTALAALHPLWQKGDRILYISSTIYDACQASLQRVVDAHPELELRLAPVRVTYPVSHEELVAATRRVIGEVEGAGGTVRVALVDAISSVPGVVVPWEALVKVFREHGIVSLVDAAHQIGQLPVDLRASGPDFWASNCHKWLHGHRGCAVLYAAKKWQYLVHSLPIGHSYKRHATPSPEEAAKGEPHWVEEWVWNGTIDWGPILSVGAALDFRQDVCGGEQRITAYCHQLALDGGKLAAEILGTEVMSNPPGEGELVANMVNVRLPLDLPPAMSPLELAALKKFFFAEQIQRHHTVAPGFPHGGKWWVRMSAQVYNDLADFETVARVLEEVCRKVNRGEWREGEEEEEVEREGTEAEVVD